MNLIIQVKREDEWRKLNTITEENEKRAISEATRSITAWAGYFVEPLRAIKPERYGQPLEVVIGGRA